MKPYTHLLALARRAIPWFLVSFLLCHWRYQLQRRQLVGQQRQSTLHLQTSTGSSFRRAALIPALPVVCKCSVDCLCWPASCLR